MRRVRILFGTVFARFLQGHCLYAAVWILGEVDREGWRAILVPYPAGTPVVVLVVVLVVVAVAVAVIDLVLHARSERKQSLSSPSCS